MATNVRKNQLKSWKPENLQVKTFFFPFDPQKQTATPANVCSLNRMPKSPEQRVSQIVPQFSVNTIHFACRSSHMVSNILFVLTNKNTIDVQCSTVCSGKSTPKNLKVIFVFCVKIPVSSQQFEKVLCALFAQKTPQCVKAFIMIIP